MTAKSRDSYFIQVGFDFGTSYSKCVCRDIITEKVWVHMAANPPDDERPFLIPGALAMQGKSVGIGDPAAHYHKDGLPQVKMALVQIAKEQLKDPELRPFRRALGDKASKQLSDFVVGCGIYFLAGALGDVKKDIQERYEDFGEHKDDYIAVNMAIPVADAEDPDVSAIFNHVLEHAVEHAEQLSGHPPMTRSKIVKLGTVANKLAAEQDEAEEDKSFFIYPEVSAGVQGFVRSRVSERGIYFFSDTGAGTVDQSVFILNRNKGEDDKLTYLYAEVYPLGSSQIERAAAKLAKNTSLLSLEKWRAKKESGDTNTKLMRAREQVGAELEKATLNTVYGAKGKLRVPEQLEDIRALFGGGGHTRDPYEEYALKGFTSNILSATALSPDVIGMQIPQDLSEDSIRLWMPRLWVAYGLSFERQDLAGFKFPCDIDKPDPEDIWPKKRNIERAKREDAHL